MGTERSQPDRDEPRRTVAWILWGRRPDGTKPLGAYTLQVVALAAEAAAREHPNAPVFDDFWVTPWPLRDDPTLNFRMDMVESREPFPSDEDTARLREVLAILSARENYIEPPDKTPLMYGHFAPWELAAEARAVLDAVSSHHDDASPRQRAVSALEAIMAADGFWESSLAPQVSACHAALSHRDDEARDDERQEFEDGVASETALRAAYAAYERAIASASPPVLPEDHPRRDHHEHAIDMAVDAALAVEHKREPVAYARAVSDVVEELRAQAGRMNLRQVAEHIEKWAADRKAGT